MPFQRASDLIQYRRIFDGRRHGPFLSIRNLLMVPRGILPERIIGSRYFFWLSLYFFPYAFRAGAAV
jgi:hypothetical protein